MKFLTIIFSLMAVSFVSQASVLEISCSNNSNELKIDISQQWNALPEVKRNGESVDLRRISENEIDDVYFFFQFLDNEGIPTDNLKIFDSTNEDGLFVASFGSTPFSQIELLCAVPQ